MIRQSTIDPTEEFPLALPDIGSHNLVILVRNGRPVSKPKPWQVQEAKAHFSKLVRSAASSPQTITVHGRRAAVLLSAEEFDRLSNTGSKASLTEFLRDSPLAGIELDTERDRSPPRHTEL